MIRRSFIDIARPGGTCRESATSYHSAIHSAASPGVPHRRAARVRSRSHGAASPAGGTRSSRVVAQLRAGRHAGCCSTAFTSSREARRAGVEIRHAVVARGGARPRRDPRLVERLQERADVEVAARSSVRSWTPSARCDRPAGSWRSPARPSSTRRSVYRWRCRSSSDRGERAGSGQPRRHRARRRGRRAPPGRRRRYLLPTRSAGRRFADRWAAPCGCRLPPHVSRCSRRRDARRHGCRIVATVPARWTLACSTPTFAVRLADPDRRRRSRACRQALIGQRRRARDDPDGGRRSNRSTPRSRRRCSCTKPGGSGRDAHGLRSFPTTTLLDGWRAAAPLAERMRPRTFDEFVGQEDLLAPGKPLREAIERDLLQSIILWGPPGTGKTTLARIIADTTQGAFRLVQRRARGHQGNPRRHGRRPSGSADRRAAGRSSSSTKSIASTRRSRTRSFPASKPATSSSSARRPRTRRSR